MNFLVNGWLNYSDNTFFKGVRELNAGHYLVYDLTDHRYEIHKWYDLPGASQPLKKEWIQTVKDLKWLFGDSVKKRMRADVNVGSCLSGGVDSSTIVSYVSANNLANKNFATVTSCYEHPRYDERIFSDEVSRVTGIRGVKVFPDLNQLFDSNEFDKMLYHQEQPFGTASHYSEFQVFKTAAANKLTVMLDGQGADEYFGGYDEFFITHLHRLFAAGKFTEALKNIKGRAQNRVSSMFSILRKYYNTALWYPFLNRAKKMLGRSPYPWLNISWRNLADRHSITFQGRDLRSLALQEMMFSSLPLQLHSEDRNSMMFGIESRLPYLDHRLVEFVIGLPCGYKIKNGISKYILREAVDELPQAIKRRTDKMGFVAPDEPWVRENHVRFRQELAEAIKNLDIFSPALLKQFDRFIDGKRNYEPVYLRAVTLHRFIKVFQIQSKAAPASVPQILQRMVARPDIVPAIVSCSHILADVNYC